MSKETVGRKKERREEGRKEKVMKEGGKRERKVTYYITIRVMREVLSNFLHLLLGGGVHGASVKIRKFFTPKFLLLGKSTCFRNSANQLILYDQQLVLQI